MDLSMKDLSVLGMQSFEIIFRTGDFYTPKIAVCRSVGGKIEIAQYEGGMDELKVALTTLAEMGPIDWMSHTADSYTVNLSEDDPLVGDIQRGITSATAMFQDGDPRAFEALQILKITHTGVVSALALPYVRQPDRIDWIDLPMITPPSASGRVVTAMHGAIEASRTLVK